MKLIIEESKQLTFEKHIYLIYVHGFLGDEDG